MTIDFIYQRHISGCNKVSDKVKSQERTVQSLNNSCLVSHGKLKRIFIYEEKKTVLFSFHMAGPQTGTPETSRSALEYIKCRLCAL